MKKIIMAVAAIAMAASMFAVDFSAMVHGEGKLFNYDGTVHVLGWNDPWDREFNWYSTGIGVSVSADKCGGSFELDNRDVTIKHSKAWIQPIDMLKVTLGDGGFEMNKETIDYDGKVLGTSQAEGWWIDFTPIDGLTINIGLGTGQYGSWGTYYWLNGNEFGETAVKVAYGADFGTISAMFDMAAKDNKSVAAGYAGSFGAINMFADVGFGLDSGLLAVDADVAGGVGDIGLNFQVYVKAEIPTKDGDVGVLGRLRVSKGLDFGNLYFYFIDKNFLAGTFACTVKPGLEFNVGSCPLDVAVQVDVNGSNVGISVPFWYRITF